MDIISQKQAKQIGRKFYFTGKPCSKGHTSERYVSSGSCKQCMDNRQAYAKQYYADNAERCKARRRAWYKNNEEHVAEYTTSYYHANKDKLAANNKRWRDNNEGVVGERMRQWRIDNPSYHKEKSRGWREDHPTYQQEYYDKNKDVISANAREWRATNPNKAAASRGRYRAAKYRATPGWAEGEKDQIAELYRIRNVLTEATGIQHHVDHIVPLQSELVCGLHCLANLQVLTYSDNISKSNTLDGC